nr:tellurite resistance TerB family protein [Gammaproteobacteria bacterium]
MNTGDLLKRLMEGGLGGATGSGSARSNDLVSKLLNSGAASGLLGGALSGTLTSLLTGKKGKKLAGSALNVGGLAAVGGLAYMAYKRYQQGAPAQASASRPRLDQPLVQAGFLPPDEDTTSQNALGLALMQAMIAAAKADGHIDQEEHQRIFEQINKLDLSAESKAFLLEELGKPLDLDAIVKLGVTPEVATEIYTASVLAVDIDSPAERAYLQMLAARLNLAPALVEQVHATAEAAVREGATR